MRRPQSGCSLPRWPAGAIHDGSRIFHSARTRAVPGSDVFCQPLKLFVLTTSNESLPPIASAAGLASRRAKHATRV
jgi:hypothetical protein